MAKRAWLCAIMSTSITEMKASKTEGLTELPLESCPKSCFSSLFFFRTGELHCLKNVQVDIEQKGRFAETLWRCNGPRGAKISNLDQNYPFSLAEVLSTLPAHSSAKDSQVHNLLRTRAWTRHWRQAVCLRPMWPEFCLPGMHAAAQTVLSSYGGMY